MDNGMGSRQPARPTFGGSFPNDDGFSSAAGGSFGGGSMGSGMGGGGGHMGGFGGGGGMSMGNGNRGMAAGMVAGMGSMMGGSSGGSFEDNDDKFKKVREAKDRTRKIKLGVGAAVCGFVIFIYIMVQFMHSPGSADAYTPREIEADEIWTVIEGAYLAAGDDLGEPFSNLDDCRASCMELATCAGITMYARSGICQMKSKQRLEGHDDWHTEIKSHYIGHNVEDWIEVPDSFISGGMDATDATFFDLTECRKACKKDHRCLAITLNEETEECFLKNKIDIHPHERWHTEVKDTFKPLLERALANK
jgi:hypothetical protein